MKFINPYIIFLDYDAVVSSQMLSDRFLEYNIKNCCQILVCSLLYMVGIRNKKICKYYFSKENKADSINKFFPNWPLKTPPSFVKYNSQEAKWCRKCKNHYDVILKYLEELFNEYTYRNNHDHELFEMYDFLAMAQYDISVRLGYKVMYMKNLKIELPWKNLPLKYRKKDIIKGYRDYYSSLIFNPYEEYQFTKRDIPEFVLQGRNFDDFNTSLDN